MEKKRTVQKTFFSGVLLLTLSTVLVKVVGLLYKIPMLACLGAVGMGYFNSAYEIYALFCVISTAGLPVALSVLISEANATGREEEVPKIYRVSLWIFLFLGVFGSLAMFFFAPAVCRFLKSEMAQKSIRAISPTVFLICVSSAIRGYFQGHDKMFPTALSQVLEAVGKLIFGILFARIALSRGFDTPEVAAAAGAGLTAGTAVSTLYLIAKKIRSDKKRSKSVVKIGKDGFLRKENRVFSALLRLAVPMTVGACAVSVTRLIDMGLILKRLQEIGWSELEANRVYGSYTTLALSVYALVPTLVNSVGLPLIPLLSGAVAKGDGEKQEELVASSFRLVALVSVPASLAVTLFAKPILLLLFAGERAAVEEATPLLSSLGVSVFLSCMITATNAVLHAYKEVKVPVIALSIGAVVKIVSAYFLIGNPNVGIFGATVSTFLCNLAVVLFNLVFVLRYCRVGFWKVPLFSILAVSGISVGSAWIFYRFCTRFFAGNFLITLLSFGVIAVLFFPLSCLFGVIQSKDFDLFPFGERLKKLLLKLHLLKIK